MLTTLIAFTLVSIVFSLLFCKLATSSFKNKKEEDFLSLNDKEDFLDHSSNISQMILKKDQVRKEVVDQLLYRLKEKRKAEALSSPKASTALKVIK